jgi:hypothetical protein
MSVVPAGSSEMRKVRSDVVAIGLARGVGIAAAIQFLCRLRMYDAMRMLRVTLPLVLRHHNSMPGIKRLARWRAFPWIATWRIRLRGRFGVHVHGQNNMNTHSVLRPNSEY